MNSKLRDILDTLQVRHYWSKPKPFTEDKQLHKIVGKAKAIKAIRQAVGEEMLELLPSPMLLREPEARGYNMAIKHARQKIKEWQGGE